MVTRSPSCRSKLSGGTHVSEYGRKRSIPAGESSQRVAAVTHERLAVREQQVAEVELRRTDYDVEAAIASMLATDDPRAKLIAEMMRLPPAQDEVIEDAERRVFAG